MLIVHRSRARYFPGADVVPWALAIGRHLFIDYVRKARRAPVWTDDSHVLELPSRADRADDLVAARELMSRIDAEVAGLPEPQRRVFELLKERGLSLRETAAALQISVGAVKLRIHRAHRSLRARLVR
jgi:RNA polymerase sigma-70 factor (ECF subfamily)